jgi:flagellar biosynthesis protein FlhF
MRITTLTADKMTDALRMIREQLGPEALILNTRKVTVNGTETLEITAAINEPDPTPPKATPHAVFSAPSKAEPAPPLPNLLQSTLQAHQLPSSLLNPLATALPGLKAAGFTEAEALAMLLGKQLKFLSATETLPQGGVHVYVGPHGAGKTTLVAKLALQAKQQGRKFGILSLDNQKIGGFEPLAIAAEIFGEHAFLINSIDDLHSAAAKLGHRQALLIDTAGINAFAPRGLLTLQQQLGALNLPMQVHLVLPANLNPADLGTLPVACHNLNIASLIFTKLDCTTRFGALVATANGSGLPLGLATHAADMATPPLHLTPEWLAETLLQLPQQPWEFAS